MNMTWQQILAISFLLTHTISQTLESVMWNIMIVGIRMWYNECDQNVIQGNESLKLVICYLNQKCLGPMMKTGCWLKYFTVYNYYTSLNRDLITCVSKSSGQCAFAIFSTPPPMIMENNGSHYSVHAHDWGFFSGQSDKHSRLGWINVAAQLLLCPVKD